MAENITINIDKKVIKVLIGAIGVIIALFFIYTFATQYINAAASSEQGAIKEVEKLITLEMEGDYGKEYIESITFSDIIVKPIEGDRLYLSSGPVDIEQVEHQYHVNGIVDTALNSPNLGPTKVRFEFNYYVQFKDNEWYLLNWGWAGREATAYSGMDYELNDVVETNGSSSNYEASNNTSLTDTAVTYDNELNNNLDNNVEEDNYSNDINESNNQNQESVYYESCVTFIDPNTVSLEEVGWSEYYNERFGFKVNYPSTWQAGPEPTNGDGLEFFNGNDNFILSASHYFKDYQLDLTKYEYFVNVNGQEVFGSCKMTSQGVIYNAFIINDDFVFSLDATFNQREYGFRNTVAILTNMLNNIEFQ